MIRIEFVCSPAPREVVTLELQLPKDATLQHALQQAASDPATVFLSSAPWDAGVWGRRVPLSTVLKDGDRVEAYRPLRCDPKEARRLRYRQSSAPARHLKRPP
jgi:putative ubiquitin-RnfH superfamily antitoxin RatB of RatAB toxin-antitoxin module